MKRDVSEAEHEVECGVVKFEVADTFGNTAKSDSVNKCSGAFIHFPYIHLCYLGPNT